MPEGLTLFDFPDPSLIIGERATTTVPAQSLYMMNNAFVIRQAEGLADQVMASTADDTDRLNRAYQLCFSRPPSEKEVKSAQKFLTEYGKGKEPKATWAALCQAMFATAEFSHR